MKTATKQGNTTMRPLIFLLLIIVTATQVHASGIALVDISVPYHVKIAFVSNFQSAHCKLLRSSFTSNLSYASIRAAREAPALAQKWVMIVENPMVADDPSCLLR